MATFESFELVEEVGLGDVFLAGVFFDVGGEGGVKALSKEETESGGVRSSDNVFCNEC